MARLDVYPLPGGAASGFLVDVQSNLLSHFTTRAVVPLLPADDDLPQVRDINPVFDIGGAAHVFLAQAIASIPARELRHPVCSLDGQHDRITRALDVLLIGI